MTKRDVVEPAGAAAPDAVGTPVSDPAPALRGGPQESWHGGLYQRVISAVYALPTYFRTSLLIAGIRATDLYTLNTALGAAIEQSVVDNLNALRNIWDPEGALSAYSFVRQPQVFPDVRLQSRSHTDAPSILMGVELKGWFALSKEGEPSFRYCVNPDACADADLLVVFPWILDEVVSGKPRLLRPFVTEALYAAEQRNHYWQVGRGVAGVAAEIIPATYRRPYPAKSDTFNDAAQRDAGNFGRVARTGLMKDFIREMMRQPVAGIPLGAWQSFVRIFAENISEELIARRLKSIASAYYDESFPREEGQERLDAFATAFEALLRSLAHAPRET